jgi:hypothetical protein
VRFDGVVRQGRDMHWKFSSGAKGVGGEGEILGKVAAWRLDGFL